MAVSVAVPSPTGTARPPSTRTTDSSPLAHSTPSEAAPSDPSASRRCTSSVCESPAPVSSTDAGSAAMPAAAGAPADGASARGGGVRGEEGGGEERGHWRTIKEAGGATGGGRQTATASRASSGVVPVTCSRPTAAKHSNSPAAGSVTV